MRAAAVVLLVAAAGCRDTDEAPRQGQGSSTSGAASGTSAGSTTAGDPQSAGAGAGAGSGSEGDGGPGCLNWTPRTFVQREFTTGVRCCADPQ